MKILKILLVISLILFIIAYLRHDDLPSKADLSPNLFLEPLQTKASLENLYLQVGGSDYIINPQSAYELYGLVVSYQHTQNWWDYYHSKWKDFLNIKDICVIWGDNLETEAYKDLKFSSGSFTCYYRYESAKTGSKFFPGNFSNNHLLSADSGITEKILAVKTGDQIRLKGYLVNYSHSDGTFRRNTSLTREDTGNNSCEVVYVTDFEVLKPANPIWRQIMHLSRSAVVVILLMMTLKFFFIPSRTFID